MKKYLAAGVGLLALATAMPALAADLPVRQVYRAPPAAMFSWTGFYVGIHGGGGWGSVDSTNVAQTAPLIGVITSPPATTDISGGLVGGQVGFNYQIRNFVLGLEAQASWANLTGSTACSVSSSVLGLLTTSCTGNAKVDGLGTFAGRLGVAFDRALVYVKGGAAWANYNYDVALTSAILPPAATAQETRWGWMVGGGVEYAFAGPWSGKIEYNYMDFGTERVTFVATSGATNQVDVRDHIHVVKAGINFRF